MLLRDQDNATVLGKVLKVRGVQGGERQSVCQAVGHDPGVIDGPGPPAHGSGGRQFLRGDPRYGPAESEALTLDFVPDAQLADRFRLALDMYEFGEKMTQSRLRRDHPGAPTSRSRGCSGTGARNGLGHQAGMPRGGRPVSSGEPSRSRAAAPCIGLATAPSLLGACRWLCRVSPGRATIHP